MTSWDWLWWQSRIAQIQLTAACTLCIDMYAVFPFSIILSSHRDDSHYLLLSFVCSALCSVRTHFEKLRIQCHCRKNSKRSNNNNRNPQWKFYRADNNKLHVLYIFTIIKCFLYNLLLCYRANHRDCVACMLFFSIELSRPLFALEHIFILLCLFLLPFFRSAVSHKFAIACNYHV